MPLTPVEIRHVQLRRAFPRGYRRSDVDRLLNEIADAADRGELPEGRLRTDNWGGYGLTAETQEPYGECVNNVMIYGWTDRSGSKFDRAW